jgi:ribosomal protein S18 acetylase RimI-like enzyme
MANAEIVVIGPSELPLIVDLFAEVFRPARDQSFFERRLSGRNHPLMLLATVQKRPAGFALGYEGKPGLFYCWLIGVLSDFRRAGIASQLMEALAAWARDHDFRTIRFECYNNQRPMLHLAINQNYDIVGVRYDADAGDNLLILEHQLDED